MDPFLGLLVAARVTERLLVGTGVALPLEHDLFSLAKTVSTLDRLSGGRVLFGVGVGWNEEELADHRPIPWSQRYRALGEAVGALRALWCDEESEFHGAFFDFGPVMFEPKPVQQPWPPIIVGGDGPAALRRAATVGDGWIPMNHPLDKLPAAVARIAELRAAAGRDGKTEVTVGGTIASPDDVAKYEDAGVDRVIVRPWQKSREAIDGMRRYADEVLANLHVRFLALSGHGDCIPQCPLLGVNEMR